ELGLARAWRLVAQARYLARQAGGCVEASERALVHADRARDAFEVKEIVEWLAASLTLGPTPAPEAERRCEQLLHEVAGERFLEVTLNSVRAYLVAMQGRAEDARELLVRARAAASDSVELYRVPYFGIYVGFVRLMDDPVHAAQELRAASRALEDVGEQTNYSTVTALLALALCALAEYAEAERSSRASEAAARANDVLANVVWRSARAMARAGLGDLEAAQSLAREAVAFAEQSDFSSAHGDALVVLAEILKRADRADLAVSALHAAVGLYEQKGNAVSA